MSMENWKIVQEWAEATADGIAGPATARAVIAKAGLTEPAPSALVKGTGKNIRKIFIHCTATKEGKDFDAATIKKWHLRQGWSDIGYHFVIGLDGEIERGRPENRVGSHVRGQNTGSIGVVYVGGLDKDMKPKDTRTEAQTAAMARLVGDLVKAYPNSRVLGHRDAPAAKACPCFDVKTWWEGEQ